MAEEVLTAPTDTVIEAEPTEVDKGLAELEKALSEDNKPAKKADTPATEKAKTVATPEAKAEEKPATEAAKSPADVLEEQLKSIEEPSKAEEKPPEPQLSAEQKQILEAFPSAQKATEVLQVAAGYQNFTQTFAGGDFASTEQMLERFNPEATDGLREYFFEKYVRNGDWVDRWIAEKEGRAEENKDVRQLKGTVAKLQQQLEARHTQEQTQQAQNAQQAVVNNFVNHVEGLFKVINATDDTDKRFIWAAVNAEVSGNQALKNEILRGNVKAVNATFKNASRTYYGKNKAATVSREAKQEAQAQHKPAIQAGAMQELSSEVATPTAKEMGGPKGDAWLDQELGKLAKGRKK